MKISVFGTGYVGLVAGTCFASMGNDVVCVDIDEKKIKALKKGIIPIFEPGLRDLVELSAKQERLHFTTDTREGVEKSDIIFIAVGTPEDHNGRADLKYVYAVAESIGKYQNSYKVVVDKSTVPVGTAEEIKKRILKNQRKKYDVDVVSNPEFLREGEAIKDFMNPDRVVIGADTEKARKIMENIYKGIARTNKPILFTDTKSAEMIKYASNAMLASRISFMNQLAPLCEKVGADIKAVAKGMGLDERIGPRFLQAGVGYGGSCFPKDVMALMHTMKDNGLHYEIIKAVDEVNERQKKSILPKLMKHMPNLKDKKIAVWGLAFKPKTDDLREAPSLVIIKQLLDEGAKVRAFDPVAQENAQKIFPKIEFGKNPYDTLKGCDALILVTEWDEFRNLDKQKIKSLLKQPIVIDGRNVYEPKEMAELGFVYEGVGRRNGNTN